MSGVVSASTPTVSSLLQLNLQRRRCYWFQSSSIATCTPQDLNLKGIQFRARGGSKWSSQRTKIQCNSSIGPGGPNSGESDNRSVLDAFFLGKALAEALNERIESAVGEFLSTIGRLQAEQQRQVQDLQEEVLERAKRAKEKAAREAMEAQGLVPKSRTVDVSVESESVSSKVSPSTIDTVTPAKSSSSSSTTTPTVDTDSDQTIRVVGASNDD